jgi:hypothetical protein
MFVVLDFLLFLWRHEGVHYILLLQVEILEIDSAFFQVGLERRLDFLGLEVLDIDFFKPRMRKDFVHVIFGAQAFCLIFVKKLLNNVDEFVRVLKAVLFFVWKDDFGSLDFG